MGSRPAKAGPDCVRGRDRFFGRRIYIYASGLGAYALFERDRRDSARRTALILGGFSFLFVYSMSFLCMQGTVQRSSDAASLWS